MPNKRTIWYFLIGVNEYDDLRLNPLPYSALDCQRLQQIITEEIELSYPNLNIENKKDGYVFHDRGDAGHQPTYYNVFNAWGQLKKKVKPTHTIILYVSGHGVSDPTLGTVLCLKDTNIANTDQLKKTGIVLQDWLKELASLKCEVIAFIDACHSSNIELPPALETTSFNVLLSCQPKQKSLQIPHLESGIFSYYLIRGLREHQELPLATLHKYIQDSITQYWSQWDDRVKLRNECEKRRNPNRLGKRVPEQPECQWRGQQGKLTVLKNPSLLSGCSAYPRFALALSGQIMPSEWANFLRKCSLQQFSPRTTDRAVQVEKLMEGRGLRVLYLQGQLQGETLVFEDGVGTSLARSRLQEILTEAKATQQLLLIEDTGTDPNQLQKWREALSIEREQAQCLVVYSFQKHQKHLTDWIEECLDSSLKKGLTDSQFLTRLRHVIKEGIEVDLRGDRGFIELIPKSEKDLDIQDWRKLSSKVFSEGVTSNHLSMLRRIDDLDEIYVPLGLVKRKEMPQTAPDLENPEKGSDLMETPKETIVEKFSQDQFFKRVIEQSKENAIIVGEPGAGKSTYLQQCFNLLCHQTNTIPIWVSLADVREVKDDNPANALETYLELQRRLPLESESE